MNDAMSQCYLERLHDIADCRGEEDPVHHVDKAVLVLSGHVGLKDVGAVNGDHVDVLPVSVFGVIYVGSELGVGHTRTHEVVCKVPGPDQAPDQVILDDSLQLSRVLFQLVDTLR